MESGPADTPKPPSEITPTTPGNEVVPYFAPSEQQQIPGVPITPEALDDKGRLTRSLGALAVGAARTGSFVKDTLRAGTSYVKEHVVPVAKSSATFTAKQSKRAAVRTGEAVSAGKDYSAIAMNGLYKAHAKRRISKIEENRAKAATPDPEPTERRWLARQLANGSAHRQWKRESRRGGKAVKRYAEQYRQEQVWGINQVGFDKRQERSRVREQRRSGDLTIMGGRRARKAVKRYGRNEKYIDKKLDRYEGRIRRWVDGRDIPGRVEAYRAHRAERVESNLRVRQAHAQHMMELRRESLEERRQKRAARKRSTP
jgi:hypothetical protein